ncbi:MAG: hypothetical protein K9N48_07945 [Verrucomicrobia bacterium]|nr:hypothetical protein [Verrucomicrobiota bacterium]MCF7707417.1 hypothetical protein [Verrucomicrobiota bacterium]
MIDDKTMEDSVRGKKVLIDSNIIIYLTDTKWSRKYSKLLVQNTFRDD